MLRGTPVWVWVLAVFGGLTVVRAWLMRPLARTWVICPQLTPARADFPEAAEPLDVLLRRVWYELGSRDTVVLVADPDWPLELWQRIDTLQRRFPFRVETAMPPLDRGTIVLLRPGVANFVAKPSAVSTQRER